MVTICLPLVILLGLGESSSYEVPVPSSTPMAPSLEPEFQRLRETLRADPQFQGSGHMRHFRLAEALAHHGDMSGAIEEYRAAIRLQPDFAEALRGLGSILLDQRDYAGAADALEAASRLREGDGDVWYWYGRASMGQEDWNQAATALRRVIELRQDDAEAYADLGLVRMLQHDMSGAEEALRSSLRIKPDNADAHHLLEMLTARSSGSVDAVPAAREVWRRIFARE